MPAGGEIFRRGRRRTGLPATGAVLLLLLPAKLLAVLLVAFATPLAALATPLAAAAAPPVASWTPAAAQTCNKDGGVWRHQVVSA